MNAGINVIIGQCGNEGEEATGGFADKQAARSHACENTSLLASVPVGNRGGWETCRPHIVLDLQGPSRQSISILNYIVYICRVEIG